MPPTPMVEPNAPAYRREPKLKQERLIAAARELFAAQGYDDTSTVQIAAHAGVSEGILFHHFDSKRGLFASVAEAHAGEMAATIFPGDPENVTMKMVVENAFAFAREHAALDRLFRSRGPELAEFVFNQEREIMVSTIEANLRYNMEHNIIRRGDARMMAEFQYALVSGAINSWQLRNDPAREGEYVAETIRSMRAMLSADHEV